MQTKYLKYGIDLGTTNSCIVTWENEELKVFLNKEQMAVTKSAVYYGKRKRTIVGYKAYNVLVTEPENVAIEFKRLMGLHEKKYFPLADYSATPEELSAEVLKSLSNNVTTLTGENVTSAVITVPAAFNTIQCEATIEAAKSAGIEHVHLLQEPIAAAIAYGTDQSLHDKTWLIFDLGGGTFDVAIVSSMDGQLQVLNHEGDNFLGGKDIDRALVETILFPALIESGYKIEEGSTLHYRILGRLIYEAEEIKIQLTTNSKVEYDIQIDDDEYEEEYGEPILLQGTIKNEKLHGILDEVILPKCIRLCNKAIDDIDLQWSGIDRILLVGGPTQIPYIREVLKQTFNTEIDYSQNPLTVVAAGAAMYASVTKISNVSDNKPVYSNNDAINVNFEYENVMSTLNGTVYGTFKNTSNIKEVMLSMTDGSWNSGWIPLIDIETGYFEIDVIVKENKNNIFTLQVRDNRGTLATVNNPLIEIRHSYNYLQPANPPLPHTISIEIETDEGGMKTKLEPIFKKNSVLPLSVTRKFFVTNTLLPNDENTFFSIRVYEGETLDNPSVNTLIFTMKITGGSFSSLLPKNEEVEVTISISESREIGLELFIPRLNEVFSKTHIYFPEKNRANTITDSIEASIKSAYEDIFNLQEDFLLSNLKNESLQLSKIDETLEQFANQFFKNIERMRNSADLAMAELTRFKDCIVIPLHKLKMDNNNRISSSSGGIKDEEIENLIEETERLVFEFDDTSISNNFLFLKQNLIKATEFKNDRLIEKYSNQLKDLQSHVAREDPAYWMDLFIYISNFGTYTDQNAAENFIQMGREALYNDDLEKLKRVVYSLYGLVPKEVVETIEEDKQLPGIRLLP
ncbi:Hsp70 family protein [Gottfriedia acidiceleris]|uniref:Hsp70 family protein n=1 Tax=Gottfriedia acidiceleris TaxID=371036 RepID=UPI00101CD3BC|nr:Hsp70 family protein [Gottfriedia acidiceleris]